MLRKFILNQREHTHVASNGYVFLFKVVDCNDKTTFYEVVKFRKKQYPDEGTEDRKRFNEFYSAFDSFRGVANV